MTNGVPADRTDTVTLGPLRENLPFLTRALRAYIRAENAEFFAEFEAEQGEIVVLSVIGLNPGISQNDLAAILVFKKSAITKLVKELEARGLVERAKVAADKRYNALKLTEVGEAKYKAMGDRMVAQHAAFLEPFDESERATLFALLNRLYAHFGERHAKRTGTSSAIVGSADD
ncbi:MarR family winged helix-turn-helix transcriptional regulator [Pelagibacterium limicola]|uniref:MarR family winged helix-turn-helix transcriptional regulator n=1 Tax=Pelagibacterium limicola TaxID=2791022 RepID=UPI0018AFD0BC|nr:MarR family winged helix-turn-helix transcriptional regulator [Pelagibacterium limicola]